MLSGHVGDPVTHSYMAYATSLHNKRGHIATSGTVFKDIDTINLPLIMKGDCRTEPDGHYAAALCISMETNATCADVVIIIAFTR